MATSLATPVSSERLEREEYRRERSFAAGLVTALTFLALLVRGYHPYAEDGGVYLPEIKRLLDPGLYPHGAEFVVGHLRYSLFAPAMAGLVRETALQRGDGFAAGASGDVLDDVVCGVAAGGAVLCVARS